MTLVDATGGGFNQLCVEFVTGNRPECGLVSNRAVMQEKARSRAGRGRDARV
jgi:hypothetical protein